MVSGISVPSINDEEMERDMINSDDEQGTDRWFSKLIEAWILSHCKIGCQTWCDIPANINKTYYVCKGWWGRLTFHPCRDCRTQPNETIGWCDECPHWYRCDLEECPQWSTNSTAG